MSDQLPRPEAELLDVAAFYASRDVSDDIGAGEVSNDDARLHAADVSACLAYGAMLANERPVDVADEAIAVTCPEHG